MSWPTGRGASRRRCSGGGFSPCAAHPGGHPVIPVPTAVIAEPNLRHSRADGNPTSRPSIRTAVIPAKARTRLSSRVGQLDPRLRGDDTEIQCGTGGELASQRFARKGSAHAASVIPPPVSPRSSPAVIHAQRESNFQPQPPQTKRPGSLPASGSFSMKDASIRRSFLPPWGPFSACWRQSPWAGPDAAAPRSARAWSPGQPRPPRR